MRREHCTPAFVNRAPCRSLRCGIARVLAINSGRPVKLSCMQAAELHTGGMHWSASPSHQKLHRQEHVVIGTLVACDWNFGCLETGNAA